jgi:hypothetical protein
VLDACYPIRWIPRGKLNGGSLLVRDELNAGVILTQFKGSTVRSTASLWLQR